MMWPGGLMVGLMEGRRPEVAGLRAEHCGLRMFSTRVLLKGTSCTCVCACMSVCMCVQDAYERHLGV